jgi:hypothetical protein
VAFGNDVAVAVAVGGGTIPPSDADGAELVVVGIGPEPGNPARNFSKSGASPLRMASTSDVIRSIMLFSVAGGFTSFAAGGGGGAEPGPPEAMMARVALGFMP